MTALGLQEIIQYDMCKVPDFINCKIELHKYRFDLISNILYKLELCIDDNLIDEEYLIIYDDMVSKHIFALEESCCVDKSMMFHIWSYIINCYEYYLDMCVDNDLFESAANLQKIKSLYNGE